MPITIKELDNPKAYLVTYEYYTAEDGTIETNEVVKPEDIGAYLFERLPYKPKSDIFSGNVKAIKR